MRNFNTTPLGCSRCRDGGASLAVSGAIAAASAGTQIGISGAMNRRSAHEARKTRAWQTAEREAQNAWNLSQWNRENEYNSLDAQRQRALAAGFSPLAIMNGANAGDAAHLESASDPSAEIPQMFNPAQGVSQAFDLGAKSFLEWSALDKEQQKIDNDAPTKAAEAALKWSQAKTEEALRQGRIDFLGVQIDCGKIHGEYEKKQIEAVSQSIVESERRCEQLLQWCRESGAKIDLMSWNKYCQRQKLDYEVKLLGQQLILTNQQALDLKLTRPARLGEIKARTNNINAQTTALDYSNLGARDYYESGQYVNDRKNRGKLLGEQVDISYWQHQQMEGSTKSGVLYTIDRGLDTTQRFVNLFTGAFQGYMYYRVGNASIPKTMPLSTPNAEQVPTSQMWMP